MGDRQLDSLQELVALAVSLSILSRVEWLMDSKQEVVNFSFLSRVEWVMCS
jgi:hypothetical protein